MPNAGLPQRLEGRFVYAAEPAYFGSIVPAAARRRRADHRRLLRHDARAHRGDARGPRRHVGAAGTARARRPRHRRSSPARRPRTALAEAGAGAAGSRARARFPPRARARRRPVRHLRRDRPAAQRPHRADDRGRRACSRTPAPTSSTSPTRRWRACAWARWPSRSASSTTSTSSAWSTSRPATGT